MSCLEAVNDLVVSITTAPTRLLSFYKVQTTINDANKPQKRRWKIGERLLFVLWSEERWLRSQNLFKSAVFTFKIEFLTRAINLLSWWVVLKKLCAVQHDFLTFAQSIAKAPTTTCRIQSEQLCCGEVLWMKQHEKCENKRSESINIDIADLLTWNCSSKQVYSQTVNHSRIKSQKITQIGIEKFSWPSEPFRPLNIVL